MDANNSSPPKNIFGSKLSGLDKNVSYWFKTENNPTIPVVKIPTTTGASTFILFSLAQEGGVYLNLVYFAIYRRNNENDSCDTKGRVFTDSRFSWS